MKKEITQEEKLNKALEITNAEIEFVNETQEINKKVSKKMLLIGLVALLLNVIVYRTSENLNAISIILLSALTASLYNTFIEYLRDKSSYNLTIKKLHIYKEFFENKLTKLNESDNN